MGPSINQLNDFDESKSLEEHFGVDMSEKHGSMHEPKRKLSRKERRAFNKKLKKPKYQNLAKKIIESKNKK
ncbi:hypothetical protein [Christiangramia forsetii]|uniref:Uncharacterized protein n=2 Tax=Christiangramia forsetii TaxID=411153 RepID=A0M457_CHRFK|nr:hypothetical protein [Christiangramia forsetii]GGG24198.1 hypothetical protein GCM10011532_04280 [Christiangramia forsetii]CAL67402.1 hypothetical protein GFO_2446 [Christiangramia forsetii KT0803]